MKRKKRAYSRSNNSNKKHSLKTSKTYVNKRVEIYGILIIMFSILLFTSMFGSGKTGIITSRIDEYLSYLFGIGRYFFPFFLLVWGVSFFIKRIHYLHLRIGCGFLLLFISILGLAGNNFSHRNIFDEVLIRARGGIAGAGIFYGLFKLLGSAGAVTVLSVLLIISILIITKISIIEVGKKIVNMFSRINFRAASNIFRKKTDAISNIEPNKIDVDDRHADRTAHKEKYNSEYFEKILDEKDEFKRLYEEKDKNTGKQLKIPIDKIETEDEDLRLPPESLLGKSKNLSPKVYKQNVKESVSTLNQLFDSFNLPAKIKRVVRGPSVTLYELTLSAGVKVQRLLSLEDDFCVAMGSPDLRFLTPIPGKSAVGIEVPNKIKSLVTLGDVYSGEDKKISENLLCVPLGKDLSGNIVYMNIVEMPHLLIAGTTNSGKSSCLNSIITSLLMKAKPSQVKFIMIDPKMVELSTYNGIPHLLTPVVIDIKKIAPVLSWAVEEMEERFKTLVKYNLKTIDIYNFEASRDKDSGSDIKPFPYILIFVDELSDLMMVSASEVEDRICRIAQKGRAVGIHLIVSTQRPSVNVVTGLIKANIPSRISFKVAHNTDSKVILNYGGAEKLIGRGDMLYLPSTSSRPERLQGAFVTTNEIEMIVRYIRDQKKPEYDLEISEAYGREGKDKKIIEEDELLYDALKTVVSFGHASASLLQRKLKVGYSRAARIIDQLEDRGLVGGYDGSKPREVLISADDLEKILEKRDF